MHPKDHPSSEHALFTVLSDNGFHPLNGESPYNPLGQTWALDPAIGEGYFWSYYHHDLFGIKIHDFTFHQDTLIEQPLLPEGLNIAYYRSISGEELAPYRRLNAGCVRSHFNGRRAFKAIMHGNVPVRSIGIEIMPDYYDDALRRAYPGDYTSPREAFLAIDETTDFPEMVQLLTEIAACRETGMAGALFYQGKIAEAVALVLQRHVRPQTPPTAPPLSAADLQQIMTVTAYISDHYAFPLSIGLLTQIACMSETKLRRLFKQVHHCTIKEYIQNQRIAQAEFLLSHTDHPIQQITESIGYSHSGHFASLFRRTTGLLPGEYRRMTRK